MASKLQTAGYIGVVAACCALGVGTGWAFGQRINNYAYDWMTGRTASSVEASDSVVVAIDDKTLHERGGPRMIRGILAEALDKIGSAHPKAVAIDVTLPDAGDPAEDARLEAAMRATPNLILGCQLSGAAWEFPLERFRSTAKAVGQVNLERDRQDAVGRRIPLEETAGGNRLWALSLEAFRLAQGVDLVESPDDIQAGATVIPASRKEGGRPLFIRYVPSGIPTISVLDLTLHPERVRAKTVFLGVTALDAAHDRLVNPFQQDVPGVEVHAHAYETMARGDFMVPASDSSVLLICAAFATAAGLTFGLIASWPAYLLMAAMLALAHWLPLQFFRHGVILPYFAPAAVAWLSSAGAAIYQHFFVRRQLRRTESEKSRYQQAIHWAAHEMRTPLTAIQGSSEIMARYSLPEEKRHQLSEMINSESKRLSRIIQTFLDVERLAEGQMELKREPFPASAIIDACLTRLRPIAERKNIQVFLDSDSAAMLLGDRELMEYALYNLLTNAVKYSAAGTEVHVSSETSGREWHLSVRDQGMGMDAREVKRVFQKFYRTKRAEASGEVGTGIGLSIVEQIVAHHGGHIDVESEPGKGSCFTIVLRPEPAEASKNAETADRRG